MVSRPHIVARTATFSVLLASFVLTGCHSSSKISAPTLAFSKVPAADQESPYKTDIFERAYKTDIIEGRATGARPGQRIVLYAKTDGRWGVCRQSGQPFTNIETDGRWKASVHLGIQYAALLVDPTYNPPEQTESLPIVGNDVVALAVVNGELLDELTGVELGVDHHGVRRGVPEQRLNNMHGRVVVQMFGCKDTPTIVRQQHERRTIRAAGFRV